MVNVIERECSETPNSLTNDTRNSYGVNGCSPWIVTVLVLDFIINALCQVLSAIAIGINQLIKILNAPFLPASFLYSMFCDNSGRLPV